MNFYVYLYIFDAIKTVYSNLNAMRSIVCIAHERENTVLPYGQYTVFHICLNKLFHQGGRPMNSRLKYSRNALHINVLPFARYFRQRYAPFIHHWRRSQDYPYGFVGTITKLRSGRICFFDIANCLHELKNA